MDGADAERVDNAHRHVQRDGAPGPGKANSDSSLFYALKKQFWLYYFLHVL